MSDDDKWYEKIQGAVNVTASGNDKQREPVERGFGRYAKDVGRAFAQGVTFGTSDEIEAFITKLRTGKPYREAVKEIRQEIAQFREDEPLIAYPSEIIGSLPSGILGGARLAARGIGAVGQGAILGGAYGAGTGEDTVSGRLTGAGGGALVGGAAAKAIPVIGEQAKEMLGRGLPMTIGQMIGGGAKRFEEAATALPFAGSPIISGIGESIKGFGRSTYNEILKPLGKSVSPDASGREAYKQAKNIISQEYEKIVPNLEIPASSNIKGTIRSVMKQVKDDLGGSKFGKEAYEVFEDAVNRQLLSKVGKDGSLTGRELQTFMNNLRDRSVEFATDDPFLRKASSGMRDVVDAVAEEMAKNNPTLAPKLKLANESFSKLIPAERAATMTGAKRGEFTPAQLLSSIKATEPSLRKQAFARGESRLQSFAEKADELIGSEIPKTGTAERVLSTSAVTGAGYGLGGEAGASGTLAGLAASKSLLEPLYSRTGRNVAEKFLKAAEPFQPRVARYASPTAGGLLGSPTGREFVGVKTAQAGEPVSPLRLNTGAMPFESIYTAPSGSTYGIMPLELGGSAHLLGE